MKILIIQFLLISSAWAIDPSACDVSTVFGAKRCINEMINTVKSVGDPQVACDVNINGEQSPECPPLTGEFTEKGAECNKFISTDESGGYGPWGNEIISYLKEKGDDSIFFNNGLSGMKEGVAACSNWDKMDKNEKEHFWVWVMASIAHIESTCNPKARNGNATNGAAVGLLQLDERSSARKWRGHNCDVKSVAEPKNNLRCGLDILEELLKGKDGDYKSNGEIWGPHSNSYWQHLRKKDGGDISDLIKLNPFCKR
jgi:hypothetical protein